MPKICRKVDELGRIVIPKQIRFDFGITSNDTLEISSDENGIIQLKKMKPSCILCFSENELYYVNNKYICKTCAAAVMHTIR